MHSAAALSPESRQPRRSSARIFAFVAPAAHQARTQLHDGASRARRSRFSALRQVAANDQIASLPTPIRHIKDRSDALESTQRAVDIKELKRNLPRRSSRSQ